MQHITDRTQFCDEGKDANLTCVFSTSLKEWESSVRRRLWRHASEYACFRLRDGNLAVINENGDGGFLYSGEIDPSIAGVVHPFRPGLEEIFDALDYQRKPISTSKGWRRPTAKGDAGLEKINCLTAQEFVEAEAKLQKWGVTIHTAHRGEKTTIEFTWPSRFSPDDIKRHEAMLGHRADHERGQSSLLLANHAGLQRRTQWHSPTATSRHNSTGWL